MPAGLMLRQMIVFQIHQAANRCCAEPRRPGEIRPGGGEHHRARSGPVRGFASRASSSSWTAKRRSDRTPADDPDTNPLYSGTPNYNDYTLEVVQRIGYDSFCPDSGVLLAKNKDQASARRRSERFHLLQLGH